MKNSSGKLRQNTTSFYIVRHGETEWNIKGLLQGHGDSPLTITGMIQARKIARKLKKIKFADVYSSDLLRAKRTAEIIALEHKLAVKTTQALRERAFGKFEGKHFSIITGAMKKLLERYKKLTEAEIFKLKIEPNVESPFEAVTRFITFLREIAVSYLGKNVLIVTHGGIMRNLLIHLGAGNTQTLPHGSMQNTALIVIDCDGVDFQIKEISGVKNTGKLNKSGLTQIFFERSEKS